MRFVWLCLLLFLSYVIAMVALFPAAPVVDKIRPQLGPVALEGVNGKLYKGVIDRVRSTDDLLPLEFQNVGWVLSPRTLLQGGAGAAISFDGYGGRGSGLVTRAWNGDVSVTDFTVTLQAKALETLLPVPIASFSGLISGDIQHVKLVNNLLSSVDGKLVWIEAQLQTPVPTQLGTVEIVITPDGSDSHAVSLTAAGGDVAMDGTVNIKLNGDFVADVLFTPSANAPAAVINGLRQMARPDAQGRVRFQRQGNLNRLI